jgi:hypothetical protein
MVIPGVHEQNYLSFDHNRGNYKRDEAFREFLWATLPAYKGPALGMRAHRAPYKAEYLLPLLCPLP